jgi:hypothetical protein
VRYMLIGPRVRRGPDSRTPLRRSIQPGDARSVPWVSGPAVVRTVATPETFGSGKLGGHRPEPPRSSGWPRVDATAVLDPARSNIRPAFRGARDCPSWSAFGCPVRGRAHRRQPAAPMRAGLIGVLSIFTFTSLMVAFRSGVSLMAETAAVPEGIRQGLEIHRTRNMFAPGVLGPGPA